MCALLLIRLYNSFRVKMTYYPQGGPQSYYGDFNPYAPQQQVRQPVFYTMQQSASYSPQQRQQSTEHHKHPVLNVSGAPASLLPLRTPAIENDGLFGGTTAIKENT